MNFLIKIIVFFMVVALLLGVSYAVLSPVFDGLGIELDNIFNQVSDENKDETTETNDTTDKTAGTTEEPTETETPETSNCNHIWSDYVKSTDEKHVKVCSVCDDKVYQNHSFAVKIVEATCKSSGSITSTCSICGFSKVENIPISTVHSYNSGVVDEAPTCTTSGKKLYTCVVCSATETETISALGHDWLNGDSGVCAICQEKCSHNYGSDGICYICSNYDADYDPELHDCSDWYDENGVCERCGTECEHNYEYSPFEDFHYGTCSICEVQTEGEKHSFGDDLVCDICGVECHQYYSDDGFCPICGNYCSHDGATTGTCSICGKTLSTSSGGSSGSDDTEDSECSHDFEGNNGTNYECVSCSPYGDDGFEYSLRYYCVECGDTLSTSTEYGLSCWGLSSCNH